MKSLPSPFIFTNRSFIARESNRFARRSRRDWTFVISLAHLAPARPPSSITNNNSSFGDLMRHILVTNAKGGCGKSTIATSLAAYFASEGYATALVDYDPQASALSWLEERPAEFAPITPVAGFDSGLKTVPRSAEF